MKVVRHKKTYCIFLFILNINPSKISLCGNGSQKSDYHLGVFTRRKPKRDLAYLWWKFVSQGVTCLSFKFPPCHLASKKARFQVPWCNALCEWKPLRICLSWTWAPEIVALPPQPAQWRPCQIWPPPRGNRDKSLVLQDEATMAAARTFHWARGKGLASKVEEAPKRVRHTSWPLPQASAAATAQHEFRALRNEGLSYSNRHYKQYRSAKMLTKRGRLVMKTKEGGNKYLWWPWFML